MGSWGFPGGSWEVLGVPKCFGGVRQGSGNPRSQLFFICFDSILTGSARIPENMQNPYENHWLLTFNILGGAWGAPGGNAPDTMVHAAWIIVSGPCGGGRGGEGGPGRAGPRPRPRARPGAQNRWSIRHGPSYRIADLMVHPEWTIVSDLPLWDGVRLGQSGDPNIISDLGEMGIPPPGPRMQWPIWWFCFGLQDETLHLRSSTPRHSSS